MAQFPLRFLQASDLHLERPLTGLPDLPEPIREAFLDAPFAAARRLFDAAVEHHVHAVLLAGDLVDLAAAGARALAFLRDQLARLERQGVQVYWLQGQVDRRQAWPAAVPWPANLHWLPAARPIELAYRGPGPAAVIRNAVGHTEALRAGAEISAGGPAVIVLRHDPSIGAQADLEAAIPSCCHYLAVGGPHRQLVVNTGGHALACAAGTPQGRSPAEDGRHGGMLVQIDESGRAVAQSIDTEVCRWASERLEFTRLPTESDAVRVLIDRVGVLRGQQPELSFLLDWTIVANDAQISSARRKAFAMNVQAQLNKKYAQSRPFAYSWKIEACSPPDRLAAAADESSFRGEFLRQARSAADDPTAFRALLEADQSGAEVSQLADQLRLPIAREQVVERASELALELLAPEDKSL